MRFVELATDNTLKLPDEIARFFNPPEKFVIIADSEGLILRRVTKPTLSELAEQAPDSNPPSPEEIADEVHKHRQEKRIARRS